ncbi:MAG: hypothetical protein K5776_07290 [Lachnospiraceae bacterium]|nr:hypothetical protein [Lachnospiraceae bacterium]
MSKNFKKNIIILLFMLTIPAFSFGCKKSASEASGVATETEIIEYASGNYGDNILLDSHYTNNPEPMRVCTFQDCRHGFTYTVTSKREINQLTLIPFYLTQYDSDFEEALYSDLESSLKPILESKGLSMFDYKDESEFENSERSFSVRQRVLLTTNRKVGSDTELIKDALKSYVLPYGFSDYDFVSYIIYDPDEPAYDAAAVPVEIPEYTNVDYKGIPEYTLDYFGLCAMYLPEDADIAGGKPLSSKSYEDIKDFLFYLRCNSGYSGGNYDPDTQEELSHYVKYTYDSWSYMLSEVYCENNPEEVKAMLENGFDGKKSVYYNPEDDSIYAESHNVSLFEYFEKTKKVTQKADRFVITYDVFSSSDYASGPVKTVDVTIETADNDYGYRLCEIEVK